MMRLLVVDDEAPIRRTLVRALGRTIEVSEASSAEEALDKLAHGLVVDAILTDYHMGGATGIDLKDRVDQLYGKLAPQVFLMSGSVGDAHLQNALAERGMRVIEKPFDIKMLKLMLGIEEEYVSVRHAGSGSLV